MKRQTVSFLYVLNIVSQSLFSLLFDTALGVGVGYLLHTYAMIDAWIYIPCILLGLGVGIVSMVRFILSAMAGLERLERQRQKEDKRGENNE